MKIDGKAIAQKVLEELKKSIKKSHLCPTLAVILVGENPASISFIKQKQKAAEFIGAKLIIKKLEGNTSSEKLVKLIGEFNKNPQVDGIIVQLPLPLHLNPNLILLHIVPAKDVDGFHPNSPFTPPVAMAILKILEEINSLRSFASSKPKHLGRWQAERSEAMTPPRWTELQFLVIGRGETAGKPIAETLKKLGYQVSIAHSKTKNLKETVKKADVAISCVGKPDIIKAEMLKPGAVVIGVGIHRNTLGKLAGDFNEEEIEKVARFYTPTPGGIGPINVASLMENLVKASQK